MCFYSTVGTGHDYFVCSFVGLLDFQGTKLSLFQSVTNRLKKSLIQFLCLGPVWQTWSTRLGSYQSCLPTVCFLSTPLQSEPVLFACIHFDKDVWEKWTLYVCLKCPNPISHSTHPCPVCCLLPLLSFILSHSSAVSFHFSGNPAAVLLLAWLAVFSNQNHLFWEHH